MPSKVGVKPFILEIYSMNSNVSSIPTTIEDVLLSKKDEDEDTKVNDSNNDTDDTDDIVRAGKVALETGDLTPLVKEELKYTIQSRRLQQGKNELYVSFEEPALGELRPDEIEKIEKRREQNRLAAQRFRSKQKSLQSVLTKKTQTLEVDNTKLRAEIFKLKAEKDELNKKLQDHLKICPMHNLSWNFSSGPI
ncbi:hypothetical protein FSP39_014694 [Pinctada imbricata]|uniref:BZIP domain-containing protein n=1 Tax=Pinctada imbricata TaxID=66713 RepID=A0AA89C3J8_PINIB|nr:hypothetical protein FSP39_014694 [Pinctada imbricata]